MRRCVFAFLLVTVASMAHAAPPNVVMIISDDQAWTDYGFMHHPAIQTPNLDRLASEGAVFTRGYVPGSLCRCSLATLITGLYPHQHAITSNDPPAGVDRHEMLKYIEATTTLPTMLAKQGYQSMQSGKWWEGNYRLGGFTCGMTHGDPEHHGRHGDEGLKIGREGLSPVEAFLDGLKGAPFFLWYAPLLPHEPHDPPAALLAKYQAPGRSEYVARYWAMCEWFDQTIGELLVDLEKRGLRENTLVVYCADNGWIQNEDKPGFAPKSKRSPYDGGLRTPIVLHWPGKIAPLRDEESLVMSLDLAPTILAACGLDATPAMPGKNLLPYCAPGASAEGLRTARPAIFGEVYEHTAVDISRPVSSLLYRWVVGERWKLILPWKGGDAPMLFDLRADPMEMHDVAAGNAALVTTLSAQIDGWWKPK